jgi:hypothetical protein
MTDCNSVWKGYEFEKDYIIIRNIEAETYLCNLWQSVFVSP